jgi:hypothetical protein
LSEQSEPRAPSVFLSYSWTSDEYGERIEQFARDLASTGIHVVLDQWDLAEGHDKYAFMERCVNDPEVDKVLILVDPRYAERADNREGGVGTETVIISPEVYAGVAQNKFIPVIMERTDDREIRLPAYLRSRIYVDLSDPERYEEEFERLIRNLHGRPRRERPPLGRRPSYLDEGGVELSTGRALPAFRQALANERQNQGGYLQEYLDRVATAFESEQLSANSDLASFELAVSESIDRWRPYRDEFIELLHLLARFGNRAELYGHLHAFFERLLNVRASVRPRWTSEIESENLAFIEWEMFLYAVGVLVKGRRFDGVQQLLQPYHITDWAGRSRMEGLAAHYHDFRLIQEYRQRRLETRWLTPAAALLRERLPESVKWETLAEADTLLWARSLIATPRERIWYPRTAAYMEHEGPEALALWMRGRLDNTFFAQLCPLLGVRDRSEAESRIAELGEGSRIVVGHVSLSPNTLVAMIASK